MFAREEPLKGWTRWGDKSNFVHGGTVAMEERLYTAVEGAFMTRVTLSTFRTKVSNLGIKGRRDGTKVYYTRAQLEDVYDGKASKKVKALPAKKAKAKTATARRVERKAKGKK
jgi:hypothetical protein